MQYLLNSSNNEEFGSLSNAFFTDFGINYFLDFTENGEIPPYAPFLTNRIGRYSFPIPNGCVPNSGKHSKKCTFYTLRFGCSFAAVNTIKPQLL